MNRSTISHICLILATILMAASLPVPSTCEMTAHPDAAPCASGTTDAGTTDTGAPAGSTHCETGCTDCSLPCCVGTAVILAVAPTLAPIAPVQTQLPPDAPARPQADPDTLGRPPRA